MPPRAGPGRACRRAAGSPPVSFCTVTSRRAGPSCTPFSGWSRPATGCVGVQKVHSHHRNRPLCPRAPRSGQAGSGCVSAWHLPPQPASNRAPRPDLQEAFCAAPPSRWPDGPGLCHDKGAGLRRSPGGGVFYCKEQREAQGRGQHLGSLAGRERRLSGRHRMSAYTHPKALSPRRAGRWAGAGEGAGAALILAPGLHREGPWLGGTF